MENYNCNFDKSEQYQKIVNEEINNNPDCDEVTVQLAIYKNYPELSKNGYFNDMFLIYYHRTKPSKKQFRQYKEYKININTAKPMMMSYINGSDNIFDDFF